MPAIQNVEEENLEKPILLLIGKNSLVTRRIIEENISRFRIIFISNSKPEQYSDNPNLYFLTFKDLEVLPKLKEKINYSIIFLGSQKQKDEILPAFEKLQQDKTKSVILITPYEIKSNYDLILSQKKYHNFYFGIVGDIVDAREGDAESSRIIANALIGKKVEISSSDNESIFPVFLDDEIKNIYRLTFGSFRNNKLYFLFHKTPETLISALHIVARVNPDAKIVFSENKTANKNSVTREELFSVANQNLMMSPVYLDASDTSFEDNLHSIPKHEIEIIKTKDVETFRFPFFKDKKTVEKEPEEIVAKEKSSQTISNEFLKKAEEKVKKKSTRKNRSFTLSIFLSIILGLLVFIVLNVLLMVYGLGLYKSSFEELKKYNIVSFENNVNLSKKLLSISKPSVVLFSDLIKIFDRKSILKTKIIESEKNLNLSVQLLDIFKLKTQPSIFTNELVNSSISNISYLYTEGEIINLKNNNDSMEDLVNSQSSKFISALPILNDLLGLNSEKKVLLVFQNSNELKPTGGQISLVGMTKTNSGKISFADFDNVYKIDETLKEHIEPPFIVKRFIQPHLYLRDSNYEPIFQDSAREIAKVYEKETKTKPDFVIAINSTALEKYLKIFGPLKVEGIESQIDSQNYEVLLNAAPTKERNTPLNDSILEKLLINIFGIDKSNTKDFIDKILVLSNLMNEKDIILYSTNPDVQAVINANNFGGGIITEKLERTLNDFLYINEFSLENNRINKDILRNSNYSANIDNGILDSTVEYTLDNKNSYTDYKVYLRFLTPQNSRFKAVAIDGIEKEITKIETNPKIYEKEIINEQKLEFEQNELNGIMTFAMLVRIPPSSKTTISLKYSNDSIIPKDDKFLYTLTYTKQPGTNSYPLRFSLQGSGWTIKNDTNNPSSESLSIESDYIKNLIIQRAK